MIFDFVDLSLSSLLKSLISHLNSLSALIEFEEHLENTLILREFNHYSHLYYLICDFNLKLASLKKNYASLRVFNDLAVSLRQQ